ncbi:MAG: HAD-IC family P-type ATPase [Caldilineaceae bacterium]
MTDAVPLLITKGALDNILAVCTHIQTNVNVAELDAEQLGTVQRRYADWSEQGYRVLGVATKVLPQQATYERDVEAGLVFQGFLLFLDPPKANVRATVADLAALGVQLKIISGDNKLVARHTASAIGLPATDVLTGTDMDKLSDDGLRHAVEQTTIFAAVDPHQKERIILTLKKQGHVVGYMGDGINDAPSLHAADVGISVNGAVDVAREAAGFVLLEKDLSILHQGIMLGRSTFANTLKYVFITTSANFGNMFSVAGASLFLPFLPMLPLQILLTNFLTDFPADDCRRQRRSELVTRPRRWDIRFIRNFMFTFGFVSSFFDYLTFFLLLVIVRSNIDQFRTGWFLESVLTELLILLVVRTRKPFFQSRPSNSLLIASLIVGATTLALPYSPISTLLGFAPLSGGLLLILVGITLLYVAASESAKHYFYRYVES